MLLVLFYSLMAGMFYCFYKFVKIDLTVSDFNLQRGLFYKRRNKRQLAAIHSANRLLLPKDPVAKEL